MNLPRCLPQGVQHLCLFPPVHVQRSLEATKKSPWTRIWPGRAYRTYKKWGVDANASDVKALGNLLNEYSQALLDHGLWDLASLLGYSLGMVLMARKLRASHDVRHKALAAGLPGVVFMLMNSSLRNMNFAHN
jgi:hypothetical protein